MTAIENPRSVTMSDERNSRPARPPDPERARRRATLFADGEFTRSVLANTTEAIKVLDLDGRIEFMNAGALRALEIDDEEERIATSWLALWPDDVHALLAAAIADAKAGRTGRFEGPRLTAKGRAGWWEVTINPIPDTGGRPARLLAISRDITERKLSPQMQQRLMQDMHHRIKNTLAMVMGITTQSLARAKNLEDGRLAVERRLMALAEAHNVLHDGELEGTGLRRIVDAAVAPYDAQPSRIDVTGPELRVSPQAALALAMPLHELCTNAVKYGALSVKDGRVEIAWSVDEGARRLRLVWRERGGPAVAAPAGRGLGTRVIEACVRDQLRGQVTAAFEPSGVAWAFEVPLFALQDVPTRRGG
jgi:PAS domain S-box-containing protein